MGKTISFKELKDNNKIEEPVAAPRAMPRSVSTTGLSSLSKAVIETEQRQCEMSDLLTNMRGIIDQYELEIKNLQASIAVQSNIISKQENLLNGYCEELKTAKYEINKLVQEIHIIWES